MYNLRIKNSTTQVTVLNSKLKTILNIITRYKKIGDYNYTIYSELDVDSSTELKINATNVLCNRDFHNEYLKTLKKK